MFKIFIIFLIPSLLFAREGVEFIPKLGGGASTLELKEVETNSRLGFFGGFAIDDVRGKYATGVFEVMYNQKGTIFQKDGKAYAFHLDYLDLSLSVNPYYYVTQNFRLNLFVGPFLDLLFLYENIEDQEVVEQNFKTYDAGMVFGAGFEINRATFECKYHYGLSNLDQTYQRDVNSSSISFLLGYRVISVW